IQPATEKLVFGQGTRLTVNPSK
uniref:Uncharacterized protein n=1 Tax=Prolemur simus TaxID=1328070 RepID=A0A8C8YSX4_PROSS